MFFLISLKNLFMRESKLEINIFFIPILATNHTWSVSFYVFLKVLKMYIIFVLTYLSAKYELEKFTYTCITIPIIFAECFLIVYDYYLPIDLVHL